MNYKKLIKEEQQRLNEIWEEIRLQHLNCCDRCKNSNKVLFDTLVKFKLKQFESELNRKERQYRAFKKEFCEDCGLSYNLHLHHIDGNRTNNDVSNLITLCGNCHTRKHMKNPPL